MRKESIIIFSLAALISIGIVGALSYFHNKSNQRPATSATTNHQLPPVSTPNKQPYASTRQQTRKAPASGRLKYPQKCTDANGHITFTDQPNCANAKPRTNLSIVDSVSPPPRQTKPQNRKRANSDGKSTNRNQVVKPIPGTMVVSCKFPIGMARKIEKKSLKLKDDPAESIWKDSYCRWVCEARVESCGNLNDYLELVSLCPRRSHMSKRSCST
jgi:hypothetical protein